jgi:hypothetical protein
VVVAPGEPAGAEHQRGACERRCALSDGRHGRLAWPLELRSALSGVSPLTIGAARPGLSGLLGRSPTTAVRQERHRRRSVLGELALIRTFLRDTRLRHAAYAKQLRAT